MGKQSRYEMRLRIESANGSFINDYRIKDGLVEMRRLDPSGRPYEGDASSWRIVEDSDIQLHHALGTVVSKWLRVRLPNSRPEWRKVSFWFVMAAVISAPILALWISLPDRGSGQQEQGDKKGEDVA